MLVVLPPGLKNKNELLATAGAALGFPDYFGHNWDAFDECLNDLAWLPDGEVALWHQDVPMRQEPEGLRIYLSLLACAIQLWKVKGGKTLRIGFPADSRTTVLGTRLEL